MEAEFCMSKINKRGEGGDVGGDDKGPRLVINGGMLG